MGLVFRYIDDNNFYMVSIEPNDSKIQLFRRQRGVDTVLQEVTTPLQVGTDYDFEVRIAGSGSGTKIQVFWNTTKIFDLTDRGNIHLNLGKIGMKNNGVMSDLDDVTVTDFEQVSN